MLPEASLDTFPKLLLTLDVVLSVLLEMFPSAGVTEHTETRSEETCELVG